MINKPQAAYYSEQGKRTSNEDAYGIPQATRNRPLCNRGVAFEDTEQVDANKGYLFLLADGVGGADGGDIASLAVVKDVGQRYYADPSQDISTGLKRVIQAGNRQLRLSRENTNPMSRMATTLVAAVCRHTQIYLASVGDSRAYLISNGEARCLTGDHSWVQEQLNRGLLTMRDAQTSNQRHRITRSLGSHAQVGVDTWQVTIKPGDRILLCTDGLSNYIDERILARLCDDSPLQSAVNNLIDTAYERGSSDNISAILIDALPTENSGERKDTLLHFEKSMPRI